MHACTCACVRVKEREREGEGERNAVMRTLAHESEPYLDSQVQSVPPACMHMKSTRAMDVKKTGPAQDGKATDKVKQDGQGGSHPPGSISEKAMSCQACLHLAPGRYGPRFSMDCHGPSCSQPASGQVLTLGQLKQ